MSGLELRATMEAETGSPEQGQQDTLADTLSAATDVDKGHLRCVCAFVFMLFYICADVDISDLPR